MSDCKSLQVIRTFLSIVSDLNNVVVCPLIFKSSSPCTSLSWLPITPFIIGDILTFLFQSVFSILLQGLGTHLSFRIPSVLPCCQLEWQVILFSLTIKDLWSGRYQGICFVYITSIKNCYLCPWLFSNVPLNSYASIRVDLTLIQPQSLICSWTKEIRPNAYFINYLKNINVSIDYWLVAF